MQLKGEEGLLPRNQQPAYHSKCKEKRRNSGEVKRKSAAYINIAELQFGGIKKEHGQCIETQLPKLMSPGRRTVKVQQAEAP
jgi:hypothetical protein